MAKLKYAGMSKRIWAALIDIGLIIFASILASVFFGEKQVLYTDTTYTNQAGEVVNTGGGVTYNTRLVGLPFVLYCILAFAYFVVLEVMWGATVGKRMFHIRVVTESGRQITFAQSIIRNTLRVVDAFPYFPPYLFGLVLAVASKSNQRLGDKVAKTIVVA